LKNITDQDYQSTVTFCRNNNCTLDKCIAAVRKQERDLQQKRLEKHRLKATIRRMKEESDSDEDDDNSDKRPTKRRKNNKARRVEDSNKSKDNCKFEGELATTQKGLLRFDGACWRKMDDQQKEFVREYNASVKHGEPLPKEKIPAGITVKNTVRRTQSNVSDTSDGDKESTKKTTPGGSKKSGKKITFNLSDEHRNEEE
jgi:hypothetical protein